MYKTLQKQQRNLEKVYMRKDPTKEEMERKEI
jgi:hypothetical protein